MHPRARRVRKCSKEQRVGARLAQANIKFRFSMPSRAQFVTFLLDCDVIRVALLSSREIVI